jgi:peptidoglycan/xylan/chitin deacetylase (PgdA/CDA1 family)
VNKRILNRAGLVTAGAAATQVAPLLTAVPALRGLWPTLAGKGRPGGIALTFDDGPDPSSTPEFLDVLAVAGVRATFFLLGEMIERCPDLPRRMVDGGHELAVHSWDHRNHLRLPPGRATRSQLDRTAELIDRRTGIRPKFFRPPYGALTAAGAHAARTAGLQPVLWTAWGKDWSAKATPDSVLRNVTRSLESGGTVLLHDSDCTSAPGAWRSALGALPALLDWCTERDLEVGPLNVHGLLSGVASPSS